MDGRGEGQGIARGKSLGEGRHWRRRRQRICVRVLSLDGKSTLDGGKLFTVTHKHPSHTHTHTPVTHTPTHLRALACSSADAVGDSVPSADQGAQHRSHSRCSGSWDLRFPGRARGQPGRSSSGLPTCVVPARVSFQRVLFQGS